MTANARSTATTTGPLVAETQGGGEGGSLSESEAAIYRAKLAEQRRLAKERKEEEQRFVLVDACSLNQCSHICCDSCRHSAVTHVGVTGCVGSDPALVGGTI